MSDSEKSKTQLIAEMAKSRKRVGYLEEKLRSEKSKSLLLRSFIGVLPDIRFSFDGEGKILKVAFAPGNGFRVDASRLEGRLLGEVLPKKDVEPLLAAIRETIATGQGRRLDYPINILASPRRFEVSTSFERVGEKEIPAASCLFRDKTGASRKDSTLAPVDTAVPLNGSAERPGGNGSHNLGEKEIAARKRLLERVLEALPVSVWVKDRQGRYLIANSALAESYGLSSNVFLGRGVQEVFSWARENSAKMTAVDETVFLTGKPQAIPELQVILPSGEKRLRRIAKLPLKDDAGNVEALVGISEDITEQKKAESELIASHKLLETVLNAIPVGLCVKDADGRYLMANPKLAALYGKSPEDLIGKTFRELELGTEKERERVEQDDRRVVESGEIVETIDQGFSLSEEKKLWRNKTKAPLLGESGEIVGIVGVLADVTETHRQQQALKTLAAQLEEAERLAGLGSWQWEVATGEVYWSAELYRQYGLTREAFPNPSLKLAMEFVHEADRERVAEYTKNALKTGTVTPIEYRIRTKTGAVKWMLGQARCELDGEGRLARLFGTSQDITEQKKIAEDLQENRALLQTVFDTIPTGVFVKDKNSRFMMVNRAYCLPYNRPPEFFKGLPTEQLPNRNAEESQRSLREDRQVLEKGVRVENLEIKFLGHDGGERWRHSVKVPLYDDGGEITGLVGVREDITERKKVEMELQANQRLLQSVFDNMPVPMTIKDREERYLKVNKEWCEIFGKTPEEVIGRTSRQLLDLPEEQHRENERDDRAVLREGNPLSIKEVQRNIADGRTRVFYSRKAPFRDDEGNLLGLITVGLDITERKKGELKLRSLSTAVEQSPDMVIISDSQGKIEYVNPAFEKVTGYSLRDIRGKTPSILKSGEQPEAFYRELWETITAGKVWEGHLKNKRKEGAPFEAEVTIAPILDESGKIVSYIGLEKDVTEKVRLEERLRQVEKLEAVGTLASGIAHEFNNLLTPIMGTIELLQMRENMDPPLKDGLKTIMRASERAANLVKQVLLFSRSEKRETSRVDLVAICNEILQLIKPALPTTIDVRTDFPTAPAWVLGEAAQIHTAIMNLCTNSRDAMPKGGILDLSIKLVDSRQVKNKGKPAPKSKFVRLQVKDNGTGMDKATQERIFEPFFTTKGVGKGTGLGLATVYGIARDCGAHMVVESEPGSGTTFQLFWPFLEGAPGAYPVKPHTVAKKGSQSVLMVDDEPMLLSSTTLFLEMLGYKVTAMESPRDAYRLFRRDASAFDIVILDQTMPELTGLELAGKISCLRPDIPIILCSGFSPFLDKSEMENAGIRHFIDKPYSGTQLAEIIQNC